MGGSVAQRACHLFLSPCLLANAGRHALCQLDSFVYCNFHCQVTQQRHAECVLRLHRWHIICMYTVWCAMCDMWTCAACCTCTGCQRSGLGLLLMVVFAACCVCAQDFGVAFLSLGACVRLPLLPVVLSPGASAVGRCA